MNMPSATTVRRTAADVSDQVGPHLSSARHTLTDEVWPMVQQDVLPKVRSGARAGFEATRPAAKKVRKRGGAAGSAAAAHIAHAWGEFGPTKRKRRRSKLRAAAVLAIAGGAAYAAYRALRLPHESDDWRYTDADSARGEEEILPTAGAPATATSG